MTDWQNLPSGPALRHQIARSAGWHMRKIPVSTNGVEYDFFIYDNDDRLAYHREVTSADLENEAQTEDETWLAAMEDEDTPRWDEDLDDALWLIDRNPYKLWQSEDQFHAWVGEEQYAAQGDTEPLALIRAWLSWADEHLHYSGY
ncbi:MAG: hypothetical protein K8L99_04965 [Anaerolineae bacterium]|nr:hypothetical protein [Anaerolineae bacterium]